MSDTFDATLEALRELVAKHEAETDKLRAELAYARRENEQLWEAVHAYQDAERSCA